MSSLRRYLTSMVLTVPPIIYFKDNFYSLYRVEGTSMEPTLYHGDVLLVRKSDIFPKHMWQQMVSMASSYEDEIDQQNAIKVMAYDASLGVPI